MHVARRCARRCIEVAPEETKLVDVIEAYHVQCWPLAKSKAAKDERPTMISRPNRAGDDPISGQSGTSSSANIMTWAATIKVRTNGVAPIKLQRSLR